MLDEKQYQMVTIGGLAVLFLMLIFIWGAVVGGETRSYSMKAPNGEEVPKKTFYLFGKKLFSWKQK